MDKRRDKLRKLFLNFSLFLSPKLILRMRISEQENNNDI